MLDQIDGLSAEMTERAEALLAETQPQLDAASRIWLDQVNAALQEWADCYFRVGMTPVQSGEEKLYMLCRNCDVPAAEKVWEATEATYAAALPLAEAFEAQAFPLLAEEIQRGDDMVSSSTLGLAEKQYLLAQVRERLHAEHYGRILGPRQRIEWSWKMGRAEYSRAMAEGCGKAPVDLHYNPEWKPMDPLPALYVDLFVFSVETTSEGNIKLSVGKGVSLKLEYNIETDEFGIEAGVGFSFGAAVPGADLKLAKAEMSFIYRPGFGDKADQIETTAALKL
ncbi:MAG: hypothetical protein M1389_11950, partial [Chloroflexi bacterium]|nr:hypothetical protein [Chloroflexota bacterium]